VLILIATTAVTASLTATLAVASGSPAKLQLRRTGVGTILVNGRGFTLYAFTRDGHARDSCAGIPGCLGAWPPVTTSGKPLAGPGVRTGLIGTITLKGGVKQVTYAGHPLYTYAGDSGPGQTFYVNFFQFGGRWPAVSAAGLEVK
jgi:predicted lipoprotein with Yx(FWY)xxD motif